LINFILKYKEYYDTPISVEKLNNIVAYSNKDWFTQITNHYGIVFTLILLEYYTNNEDYFKCQKILTSIEDLNKYHGTNYSTKLKHYK